MRIRTSLFSLALVFFGAVVSLGADSKHWEMLTNCQYLANAENDGDSFRVRSGTNEFLLRLCIPPGFTFFSCRSQTEADSGSHALPVLGHELAQREAAGQLSEQVVFFAFHSSPRFGTGIVVTEQMEDAVDEVADEFARPSGSEAPGLSYGFLNADDR